MMQNGGMRPALLPMVSMDAATKGGEDPLRMPVLPDKGNYRSSQCAKGMDADAKPSSGVELSLLRGPS
jgi:hypothetical protein